MKVADNRQTTLQRNVWTAIGGIECKSDSAKNRMH